MTRLTGIGAPTAEELACLARLRNWQEGVEADERLWKEWPHKEPKNDYDWRVVIANGRG
jgi:hypothetical protein